jgi:hypothetical protein
MNPTNVNPQPGADARRPATVPVHITNFPRAGDMPNGLDFEMAEFYSAAAVLAAPALGFALPRALIYRKVYAYLFFAETTPSWVRAVVNFKCDGGVIASLPLEAFGGAANNFPRVAAFVNSGTPSPDALAYWHGANAIAGEALPVQLLPNNLMLEADSVEVNILEVQAVTALRIFIAVQSCIGGNSSYGGNGASPGLPTLAFRSPPPPPNFGDPPTH